MPQKIPLLKAILWELCQRLFSSVLRFWKTKGYYYWKHNFCRLCVRNSASGLLLKMTSQFSDMAPSTNLFDVILFLLPSLVTGPSFISVSSLVLELWQFSFIRDWPEIQKSEIPSSEFCPISGDWGKLWIPNLARISLIECYWMLQNSSVTALTVFELLRKNQVEGKITHLPPTPSPRLGLKHYSWKIFYAWYNF